jgi:hypothetical protein
MAAVAVVGFTESVRLSATPAEAYDYLVVPGNRPQWQSSLRSVDAPDDAPRAGLRWQETTVIGVSPRMQLTETVPGQGFTEVGTWRGVTGQLRITFVPTADGCRAEVVGSVAGRGAYAVLAQVAGRLRRPPSLSDLRRAGRLLERRSLPRLAPAPAPTLASPAARHRSVCGQPVLPSRERRGGVLAARVAGPRRLGRARAHRRPQLSDGRGAPG